jgi:pimeloyl-ACP methyl ester carboxylesterase
MGARTLVTFPGVDGPRHATVERPAGGRRAVVVVGEAGERRVPELRAALVDAGLLGASLDPLAEGEAGTLPRVEDVGALAGTLFATSSATVGMVGLGNAATVATAAATAVPDLVAALVLVGGTAAEGLDLPDVQVTRLSADAAPADVVQALALGDEPTAV